VIETKAGERFDRNYGTREGVYRFTGADNFKTENISLSGSAELERAEARRITISGSAAVKSVVSCEELRCSGSFSAGGDVSAGTVTVSGSFSAGENIRCRNADISGSCRTGGSFMASGKIEVAGSLACSGSITCDELKAAGRIGASSVTAGRFSVKGGGEIGTVNCDTAEINSGSRKGRFQRFFERMGKHRELRIHILNVRKEAHIGHCTVDELTVRRAVLSGGCVIRKLIYSDTFVVEENAIVLERVKLQ
jgi:cytoskeletal protein CcmA (bactofilin family)